MSVRTSNLADLGHGLLARAHTRLVSGDIERPPGPPDPTGVWNAVRLTAGTLELLRELTDRYGDIVYFKLLGSDYYLINNPADIEHALAHQAQALLRDEYTETLDRFLGHSFAFVKATEAARAILRVLVFNRAPPCRRPRAGRTGRERRRPGRRR